MRTNKGYSLTELITVIAIIGILATIVLASLQTAREKGRTAKAESELLNMRDAIGALLVDTKKYPNGCTTIPADYEVTLDNAQAGLSSAPTVGVVGTGCEWTARDVYLWNGPYMAVPKDPWGNSYIFDPDYFPEMDCIGSPYYVNPIEPDRHAYYINNFPGMMLPALVSNGANGATESGLNVYDCDDVYSSLH